MYEDESECYICIDCAKDYKLKKFIQSQSTTNETCHFCGENNHTCLQILENKNFMNFIRALVRYHYWEEDYNRHFGGYSVHELLMENSNEIFNTERFKEETLCFDNIICGIEDYTFDDESIVELYYGHEDGVRCSFGEPKKNDTHHFIDDLKNQLLEKNYFLLEDYFNKEIKRYEKTFDTTLREGIKYYRARLGYSELKRTRNTCFSDYTDPEFGNHYIPHKNGKISAPPVTKVEHGRLNRHNVSYLYLATDVETAIAEVRPHPGHKVSTGCFLLKRDLRVADFDYAFIHFSDNEKTLNEYSFLNHIDKLLSMPITPEDRHMYLITQFFSDCFRKLGFDAISFTSSVGSGQNLLVFDPENFQYIEENASVYQIKRLEYEIKKLN